MKSKLVLIAAAFLLVLSISVTAQKPQRHVDDPEDQEDLNRELWEFAKQTPYESILRYVTETQRRSKDRQTATFPSGEIGPNVR